MMKRFRQIGVAALAMALVACATSSGVVINRSAPRVTYTSVYVVVHGGNGADMDALLQKELLKHGLDVSAGPDGSESGSAQLIVRYADDWRWDLKMYLRSLDVMAYDASSHVLLATGSWKNSAFHGFYSEDKVVADVVKDAMSGISAK